MVKAGDESFVVRFLARDGRTAGAGVLVGRSHIVTCAHVVNAALGYDREAKERPEESVRIDFPHLEGASRGEGLLAHTCVWKSPAGADVAGLTISGELPVGASPARFVEDGPKLGSKVSVPGFPGDLPGPPGGRPDGIWGGGTVRGAAGPGRFQIDSDPDAAWVRPGFSGAPVIDHKSGRVAGIIVMAASLPRAGNEGQQPENYSTAIGAAKLREEWPEGIDPGRRSRDLLLAGSIAVVCGIATAAAAVLLPHQHPHPLPRPSNDVIVPVGMHPQAVAVNPAAHAAYVANVGGDSLSVIDTRTHAVTATASTGRWPAGVAVDPGTHAAYVANAEDGNVSVIDMTSNATETVIPVEGTPQSVALDPTTRAVYVTNAGSNSVSVINTATNTVAKTIRVGTEPDFVAVDAAAHAVYVANVGGKSISVIDTRSNTLVDTIKLTVNPAALAVDPATRTIYVTNPVGNSVVAVTTGADGVANFITVGAVPSGVTVDPADHEVYVVNSGANSISVINADTNKVAKTIRVGRDPHAVAVDPTSHTAYVANYGANSVSVIKIPDLQHVQH